MWIENPFFGQRTLLVKLPDESGGRSYEIEYFNHPFTGKGSQPLHFHTIYTERFIILSGKARYRLGNVELDADARSPVILPHKIPHLHPWSISDDELHVRQIVEANPPDIGGLNACLNTGITFCGLASEGKINKYGLPGVLQLSVSAKSTMPVTYSAGMPISIQRIIIGFLAALGKMAGYRPTYSNYGEVG